MSAKSHERARVAVVGGGAWGIALATTAAKAGSDVLLYSRKSARTALEGVRSTQSLGDVAAHGHLIVLAIPSDAVRAVARELGDVLDGRHAIVHGVRGLVFTPTEDGDSNAQELQTISSVLREETPVRRLGALGGPVLTRELAAGSGCVMVVASHFAEVIALVRHALGAPALRIYATEDLTGLEWASALTGILAVAVGFARGVGLGGGLVSAFVTRGIHEAARVAAAAGAQERTFFGLGGFGDLLASIAEEERPEVRLGEALARGQTIEAAQAALGQRVEALELAPRVAELASHHGIAAPIFKQIAAGMFAGRPAREIVQQLMMGPISGPA